MMFVYMISRGFWYGKVSYYFSEPEGPYIERGIKEDDIFDIEYLPSRESWEPG